MNLLAIPNDATNAYRRTSEKDFLMEFNPNLFFDDVKFLNWKDKKDEEYAGIKSINILRNKEEAFNLTKKLGNNEIPFQYPLFTEIFEKEKDSIIGKIKKYDSKIIRAFNTNFAGELGNIVKEFFKIPLVISAHDPSRLTEVIKKADSLVCISKILKEKCIEEYEIDEEKISLIYQGVNMNLFYPKNSDIGYYSKNKILSVGRIVPSKNLENLLNSIRIIKSELKDIKHLHLGKGTEEEMKNINELKDGLGLRDVTYFLGEISKTKLPFYYSWADVHLFPTLWEGLGKVAIESLACGTPTITTNYAPMTEIIEHKYNGLLINPNNPKEIAEQTIRFFKDKSLRKKLEDNSRKSVVDKYSYEKNMRLHCENYERVVKNHTNLWKI